MRGEGIVKKSLIFILFLLFSNIGSAAEWEHVTEKTSMSIGDIITAGEYNAVLSDYSMNWDGEIIAVAFEIYKGDVYEEKIIIPRGTTVYFGNDTHRLNFRSPDQKIECSLDSAILPYWEVCSTTNKRKLYNYTVIQTRLTEADAKNIKVYFEFSDINITSKPSVKKYSVVSKDKNLTSCTIKWSGNGNITMNIEYKDLDGNKYVKTFDVLNSTVWKTTSSNTSTISESRKDAENDMFKCAVIRAMQNANLTNQQYRDLYSVAHLSGNYKRATFPERRYQYEQNKLKNSITRAMKYLDFTDVEKEKLSRILEEMNSP